MPMNSRVWPVGGHGPGNGPRRPMTSAADLKSLIHSRPNRVQGLQIESGTRIIDSLVPITFRSPRKGVAAMERGLRKVGTSRDGVALVVQFQHSHPIAAGTFANVGIEGPLENVDSSGALDLTFACEGAGGRVANVKSAPLAHRRRPMVN
jgi:hypothetical protein